MRESRIDALVRRLSRLDLERSEARDLLSRGIPHRKRLLDQLAENKTLPQFVRHLATAGIEELDAGISSRALPKALGSPQVASVGAFVRWFEQRRDQMMANVASLVAPFPDALFIKGSALCWYLPDYQRAQVDVDLYFPALTGVEAFMGTVERAGYLQHEHGLTGEKPGWGPFLLNQYIRGQWSIGLHAGLQRSEEILVAELGELLAAESAGRAPRLPPLVDRIGAPFPRPLSRGCQAGCVASHPALSGRLAALPIRYDGSGAARPRAAEVPFVVPPELHRRVVALARRERVSRFVVLLAAFEILLWRVTGRAAFSVDIPVSSRSTLADQVRIGNFVRHLQVGANLSGGADLRRLLSGVRSSVIGAFDPGRPSVEEWLADALLGHRRIPTQARSIVFDFDARTEETAPGWVRSRRIESVSSLQNLSFRIREARGELCSRVSYAADLFDREEVDELAAGFVSVLWESVGRPERRAPGLPEPAAIREEGEEEGDCSTLVARIFGEVLGLERVEATSDFFELGGSSVLAIRVATRLEERHGVRLELAEILSSPTARELGALLAARQARSRDRIDRPPEPKTEFLVRIRPGGGRRPLFLVHALGGGIRDYRVLARHLPPDRPVYGLVARGLDPGREPMESVPEMAAAYLEEILALQPREEYLLGGHSLGAHIAFEMAQQLLAQGRRVPVLAIFDQAPANLSQLRVPWTASSLRNLAAGLAGWWGHLIAEDRDRVAFRLRRRLRLLQVHAARLLGSSRPPGLRAAEVVDLSGVSSAEMGRALEAHWGAARRYLPRTYDGQMILFRSRVQGVFACHDSRLGWGSLVRGGVAVVDIPGNHSEILKEPQAALVARALEEQIARGRPVRV